MLGRIGKSIGSHAREMNVHYFPTKMLYDIPLYGEQRDMGKLIKVEIKDTRIFLDFDICRKGLKKDTEYLAIEKCPFPESTTQSGAPSGSDVTSNTSTP